MDHRALSSRFGAATIAACCLGMSLSCSDLGGGGPSLTSASPARISARGGEVVTLHGDGFGAKATVRVAGAEAGALAITSASEATFTTPPLFAGRADVDVVTADGETVKLPGGLEVMPLALHFVEAPPYALPAAPDGGTPATITGAALGDFDGDGAPDLITCATECRFLRNDGRGNFTDAPDEKSSPRFPGGALAARSVLAMDFDGDGDLDLFVGLDASGPGALYVNDGHGVFTAAHLAVPVGTDGFTAAIAGDLDGDGKPDLVLANAGTGGAPLRVYWNRGAPGHPRFVAAADNVVPAAGWAVSAMALADVDGDGHTDVLLATSDATDGVALRVLLADGGELHEAPVGLPSHLPGAIGALATGDVDGDGAIDVVVTGDGQDRLFLNDGAGHFFDATVEAMPVDASKGTSIALVDLDRDRHPDLLIGNDGAETRLYLNDGAGRFLDHTPLLPILADPTLWVGATDLDADGDADLLVLNAAPTPARLYLSVEPPSDDAH